MVLSNNDTLVTPGWLEPLIEALQTGPSTGLSTRFEVEEVRGHIDNAKVSSYQVALKLGFRYASK